MLVYPVFLLLKGMVAQGVAGFVACRSPARAGVAPQICAHCRLLLLPVQEHAPVKPQSHCKSVLICVRRDLAAAESAARLSSGVFDQNMQLLCSFHNQDSIASYAQQADNKRQVAQSLDEGIPSRRALR